ncbi:dolichol-P-glucose transferase [Halosolutus gelatinilyticus]|uniref:dolichol-P-glucose transferase n=1 Tax=Halosolutus gelatinilyticus TaxID=2931975 RepID=UPI001FF48CB3|nr:dolichol-P-glucose transferase [Halosolutus gelatinilyticus]
MTSVGIVVPAFRPDVDRLVSYVAALDDRIAPETIRIELDAPDPATRDALSSLPAQINAVADRRGKGAAITDGFEALETPVLAFADADGSTPARSLAAVVDVVVDGVAPVCAGSRRHPTAPEQSHRTVGRRLLGDGFAWLARQVLDVSLYDYQCGAKALTRPAWESVRTHLYERGFAWDLELLAIAAAMGFDVAEQPVVWNDVQRSTVDPIATPIELCRAMVSVRHRAKVLQGHPVHSVLPNRSRPLVLDD